MEKYIPQKEEELVEKMKENNFKGNYYIKDKLICWNIHPEVEIKIVLNNNGEEVYIQFPNGTHEHVSNDEVWEYLCSLNKEGGVIVIKNGLFKKKKTIYFTKNIKISKGNIIYF